MKRKLTALLLAGLLCLSLAFPAYAAVEELTSLRIDEVAAYSPEEGVYTVVENGRYGYYYADGTVLLEPNYASASAFHDGMAAVSITGQQVRVQKAGGTVSQLQDGRFGYVDANGTLMIPMQYARAFPFSEGRAFVVKFSGQLALLDRSGTELAVFPDAVLAEDEAIMFHEGLAVIPVKGGEDQPETVYLVVDAAGKEVCTLTDAAVDYLGGYHNGRIAVAEEGEWTLDEAGEPVEFLPVPGSWGYRNEQGVLVIEGRFEEAAAFSGGMAVVSVKGDDGKTGYGLLSPFDEEIVPPQYDGAAAFEDGTGALLLDGRWAYVDGTGALLTGFDYDRVEPFRDGRAFVLSGGELQSIDETGRVLFTCGEAVRALDFSGGAAALERADGMWGICDEQGNVLVDFTYETAYHWDRYLWLKRGDLWRIYDTAEVIDIRSSVPEGGSAEVGGFADVPADAWYAEAVTWATDHDVISGTGGGLFSPGKSCTTGEILTFFWRAVGRPEPEIENPFTDVSPSNYYYEAALWAYENGMKDGEIFGAAELCSRGMAVSYLWQAAGCPGGWAADFDDVSEDAAYAQAVAWAVNMGITSGSGGGLFAPDSICNRGQIVTFLYRFLTEPA